MPKLKIFFIAFLCSTISFAQTSSENEVKFKEKFIKTTEYLFTDMYPLALKELKILEAIKPDNSNIQFQLGFCYLQAPKDPKKAIEHLEKAAKNTTPNYIEGDYKQEKAPIFTLKYLADAYHLNYEFKKAIKTYQEFKEMLSEKDAVGRSDVDKLIAQCNRAIEAIQKPVNIELNNVGNIINSEYPDYGAVVTADESFMAFTSRRPGSTGGIMLEDGSYYEDIYISEKVNNAWTEPKSISSSINSNDHEAALAFSADGQTLLIYKYDEIGKGDIYSSKLSGKEWSVPEKLGSDINSTYLDAHASISPDGNFIYFSSNRPGGYGGMDIYFAKKLPNNEWSLVLNCGPSINTEDDESFPFIHPDDSTLYFSSNHNSIGGYDVFVSNKIEDLKWSKPKNLGFPVNTPDDDVFFIPTTDGKRAYFSSIKNDGVGQQDIYILTFLESKNKPVTVYKGSVMEPNGTVPADVFVNVTDNETGEIIGVYTPNSQTGKYLIILPTGKSYNITYEADNNVFFTKNIDVSEEDNYFEIEKPVLLDNVSTFGNIDFPKIHFESMSYSLTESGKVNLDKVIATLTQYPKMILEVGGHADVREAVSANYTKLSQQRSESVKNYLEKNGIPISRIVSKGYGISFPTSVSKNADGSINEKGSLENRRVEFKVISN